MKTLIKNITLISMDEKKEKIQNNMDILIDGNKIEKIQKNEENLISKKDPVEVEKIKESSILKSEINSNIKIIDGSGKIALPGLINTHAHVPMSIFRETLDGYNLQDWLNKKIWPMEAKLTNEDIYYASYLTFIEMVKTGCTTINDMYFMTDSIIDAQKKVGGRLQTTRCLMGDGDKEEDLHKIDELNDLIEKYRDLDLVTFNVGIHGLYTSNRKYVDTCIEYARKKELPIHIHFCENAEEVTTIKQNYNENPVDVIEEDFEGNSIILAHCVKLTDEDIERLGKINNSVEKKTKISIATCPVSNLKLGCGIAKINKMKEVGLNVSIGTDGQGSGSNLDLFEAMKYVALLQKGQDENPEEMPAYEVLKMS